MGYGSSRLYLQGGGVIGVISIMGVVDLDTCREGVSIMGMAHCREVIGDVVYGSQGELYGEFRGAPLRSG
jgi:hypothetical protein